ncbi:MAG TPA: prepilin-type N-terminal cleavage/methylation domain-containing protein [Gemmatimonadaceae bacterium]|nr:prepilin-type N-terminal cleavage/methylation domain-containing protein [Gemmatimonadaceae bacterium]
MRTQLQSDDSRRHVRSGFTMIETMIVITILATIVAMALPQFNRTTRHRRVIAAATAVAGDVEAAFSLAARQRKPLRITYDAGSGEIRVADRLTGTVYRRRPLRMTSEYKLDAVTFIPATVEVFPGGISSAGFNIGLTNGAFQRQIQVTRTGLTRVTP